MLVKIKLVSVLYPRKLSFLYNINTCNIITLSRIRDPKCVLTDEFH